MKRTLPLLLLTVVMFIACQDDGGSDTRRTSGNRSERTIRALEGLQVEYSYGRHPMIPDEATAYNSEGKLVGRAKFTGSSPIPGASVGVHMTIEETHYDPQDTSVIVYQGSIVFSSVHRRIVGEHATSGTKVYEIFGHWPIGGF